MTQTTHRIDWRCRTCGGLLGVQRDGRLHIKRRGAQYAVRGEVLAVCPRCAELNTTRTVPSPAPNVAAPSAS